MKYVVIGGGIAGVCCAEELCRLNAAESITLISADSVLKVQMTSPASAICLFAGLYRGKAGGASNILHTQEA